MNDKQIMIIETAMRLFAAKGYSTTSIQEISTESGISKGAFYLHFKSKEELLLSILTYYFDSLFSKLNDPEFSQVSPREKFSKQLTVMINTFIDQKEFIIMQTREQAIPLNNEIRMFFYEKQLQLYSFYANGLTAIYGKKIENHLWDISLLLEGMFHSFIRLLIFDKTYADSKDLTEYIMRRMDSIIDPLLEENPILGGEKAHALLNHTFLFNTKKDLLELIDEMRGVIESLGNKEDLEISLEVLETEFKKEHPRIPVIQGMLYNLHDIPELKKYKNIIAESYNIDL